MRITIFSEELRKCLDAAGLADCGENDAWSYWYQRVMKAHNEAVERQAATEQAENAKLRELCVELLSESMENVCSKSWWCDGKDWHSCNDRSCGSHLYVDWARELGIEVDC